MLFKNSIVPLLTAGLVVAAPSQTLYKRDVAFDFGNEAVRGVNIGGWLVLEPWITPSLFESLDQSLGIVDEFTLTQKMGASAINVLRPHWNSWCNYTDFARIANAGFNTVRIPVGYWAYHLYDGETYTQGSSVYIDAAIDWARALKLKIWIDLHGAPGSQNGFDNSGHKVQTPGWQQGATVQQTLDVLKTITQKYAAPAYQDVIVAIELLNEPLTPELNFDEVKQFYRDGYYQTRDTSDTPVVIHDGFKSASEWNGFLSVSDNNAQKVIVDHHEYQVFDNNVVALQNWQHRQLVCNNAANWGGGADKWVVVGEWSAGQTDCAKYLNGYKVGARYDGTYPGSNFVGSCAGQNSIASWSAQQKSDVRQFIEAQLDTYEKHAQGWIFWNFKTEIADDWNALALVDAGLFPQPLTARQYPPACSN